MLAFVRTVIRWLRVGLRVPTFLDGLGSVVDIGGTSVPRARCARDPWAADRSALQSDGRRVRQALHRASARARATAP